jgi:hypothetical protein
LKRGVADAFGMGGEEEKPKFKKQVTKLKMMDDVEDAEDAMFAHIPAAPAKDKKLGLSK